VAPYDVRQGNFTGANVNSVTRSGTNQFIGSIYTRYRNQSYVGTQAAEGHPRRRSSNEVRRFVAV